MFLLKIKIFVTEVSYCWRLPSGWWRRSICPITNVQRQFVFVVQPVLAQWCQYIVRVSSWSNPSPLLCTFLVVNKWDEVLQSQTCFINAIRLNTTIIHFKDQINLIFDVPKVPTLSLLFTLNVCFNNYRPQQLLRNGNVFTGVCHFFCSPGGDPSMQWGKGGHPTWADTPTGQTPAPTTNCHWSGRYASYWNAF